MENKNGYKNKNAGKKPYRKPAGAFNEPAEVVNECVVSGRNAVRVLLTADRYID